MRVVCDLSISADGYVAVPNQSEDNPLATGRWTTHAWFDDDDDDDEDAAEARSARLRGGARNGPKHVRPSGWAFPHTFPEPVWASRKPISQVELDLL